MAALISVVSPRYVRSEWGRRELVEFCKAAESDGGVRVGDKARLFKVLKTPVPLDQQPPELQSFLGYEFFKTEPNTGRVREFSEIFGPEAERDFWIKLDDLAHDVCSLLETLDAEQRSAGATTRATTRKPAESVVYLAVTTGDLNEQREALKRDLEQHGHTVLPDQPLPMALADLQTAHQSRSRPMPDVDSSDWENLQSRRRRLAELADRDPERSRRRAERRRDRSRA